MNIDEGKEKLLHYWNEKPVETLLVGAAVVTAVSKLIDSISGIQSRRAYARRVDPKRKRR